MEMPCRSGWTGVLMQNTAGENPNPNIEIASVTNRLTDMATNKVACMRLAKSYLTFMKSDP